MWNYNSRNRVAEVLNHLSGWSISKYHLSQCILTKSKIQIGKVRQNLLSVKVACHILLAAITFKMRSQVQRAGRGLKKWSWCTSKKMSQFLVMLPIQHTIKTSYKILSITRVVISRKWQNSQWDSVSLASLISSFYHWPWVGCEHKCALLHQWPQNLEGMLYLCALSIDSYWCGLLRIK